MRIGRTCVSSPLKSDWMRSKPCDGHSLAMTTIHRDWLEFLNALLSENTRFLLIGAHALAYHVEGRLTEDIDWTNVGRGKGVRFS